MRTFIINILIAFTLILLSSNVSRAADPWDGPIENNYWGDLHVHTNFSLDAFAMFQSLGRYTDEAGMYAAHCGKLDFYSVTDHAETLTRNDYWVESIRSAKYYNEYGKNNPDPDGDPSIVAFTGWEWTQQTPYGHKNVILKYDDPDKLPPSMVRCYKGNLGFRPQDWFDNKDLTFLAETPSELYTLVEEYCTKSGTGCKAIIIPHGNGWGQSVLHTDWDIQLNNEDHNPELQRLIEVYSKHGNSEEYKYFPPDYRYYYEGQEVDQKLCQETPCNKICQEPNSSYKPCCWQAGEIVAQRCADPDSSFCKEQIELSRKNAAPFPNGVSKENKEKLKPEYRANPEKVTAFDWGNCGQCLDCYQPAFKYNPDGSVQSALSKAGFDENGDPFYYRFGFINSTDTHDARPGSVMEEKKNMELAMAAGGAFLEDVSASTGLKIAGWDASTPNYGYERISSFMNPGGLMAIQSMHRNRDELWQAIADRHVYGTSGGRIDLWLRAEVLNNAKDEIVTMGDITSSSKNPTFHLKANGAFKEDGTCRYDDHPEIGAAMSKSEFEEVCYNQCYSPSDERLKISKVEIVKIRQPMTKKENDMENRKWSLENPDGLIMDPYEIIEFDDATIEMSWTDKYFEDEKNGRSVAYYFRVIQEPTQGYNCGVIAKITKSEFCTSRGPRSHEVAQKANPQDGSTPVPRDELDDVCYSSDDEATFCEERAWSSPVYIVKQ